MRNTALMATVERLIDEGTKTLGTRHDLKYSKNITERASFAKWLAGCRHLLEMLGRHSPAFNEEFKLSADYYEASRAEKMLATLHAIRESIQYGLLASIEDLVTAEVFESLLEQADYLLSQQYFLAAGVLGRAVLEERLRNWCASAGCPQKKTKPTLSDFNVALYTAKVYSVSVMKHVDSMVAIGNDAAHNKPGLKRDDVARLLRDLREFLAKHSP